MIIIRKELSMKRVQGIRGVELMSSTTNGGTLMRRMKKRDEVEPRLGICHG